MAKKDKETDTDLASILGQEEETKLTEPAAPSVDEQPADVEAVDGAQLVVEPELEIPDGSLAVVLASDAQNPVLRTPFGQIRVREANQPLVITKTYFKNLIAKGYSVEEY